MLFVYVFPSRSWVSFGLAGFDVCSAEDETQGLLWLGEFFTTELHMSTFETGDNCSTQLICPKCLEEKKKQKTKNTCPQDVQQQK